MNKGIQSTNIHIEYTTSPGQAVVMAMQDKRNTIHKLDRQEIKLT